MPIPWAFNWWIVAKSCSVSRSEREEVGSSMMRILDLMESALATSTICCWAVLKSAIRVCVSTCMFRLWSSAAASACIFLWSISPYLFGNRAKKMFCATSMYGIRLNS